MKPQLSDDAPQQERRQALVDQLAHHVADERVLTTMRQVPRHFFVPASAQHQAYDDCALPLGRGQTISQPRMVAEMLEALELQGDERVLDVGTGSGYQAALLSRLSAHVCSVDIVVASMSFARANLARAGIEGVELHVADGSLGFPTRAPFDAIIVAAGAPRVPEALVEQLADGGRLVIPVGRPRLQELTRLRRRGDQVTTERLRKCVFVPLLGEQGWSGDEPEIDDD